MMNSDLQVHIDNVDLLEATIGLFRKDLKLVQRVLIKHNLTVKVKRDLWLSQRLILKNIREEEEALVVLRSKNPY